MLAAIAGRAKRGLGKIGLLWAACGSFGKMGTPNWTWILVVWTLVVWTLVVWTLVISLVLSAREPRFARRDSGAALRAGGT